MPNLLKHFYTPVIFAIGQLTFFIIYLATYLSASGTMTLDAGVIWIRTITLCAGSAILAFILVKFLVKYRTHPTRARLNVLLGLIAFLTSTTVYIFATTFNYGTTPGAGRLDDYIHDVSRIAMYVATYLFVVFGITFMLGSEERKADKIRHVFDIFLLCTYATYVIGEIAYIAGSTSEIIDTIGRFGEYMLLMYGLVSLVLLVVIAGRALNLAKRTTDDAYKAGLKALATSYFLLFASVLTLLLNGVIEALEENKYIIVFALGLLIVGFYFIYAGFVKPSGAKKE